MKIITWNVHNAKDGKSQWAFIKSQNPEIVLLQEAREFSHYLTAEELKEMTPYSSLWEQVEGKKQRKGVLIYSDGLQQKTVSLDKYRGRLLVTKLKSKSGLPLVVVNVHGDTNRTELYKTVKEAIGLIYDELSPILKSSQNIILGGDLNLSVHYRASDVPIRDRLNTEFGLVNCTQFLKDKSQLHLGEVPTYKPHSMMQDDYIFVSKSLASKVSLFDVLRDSPSSDHFAVVAEIDGI